MNTRLTLLVVFLFFARVALAADEPPKAWVDPATHHRVVRLSDQPGTASLYFHQNAYTPDGTKLLVTTPDGLSTIDLGTRKIEPVVTGHVRVIVTGRKTGDIYFMDGDDVCVISLASKERRTIGKLPAGGSVYTVNADETLLAGTITHAPAGTPATAPISTGQRKAARIDERFNLHLPMELFVMDAHTGDVRTFHPSRDWLNHLQFSPTDPQLLLFCHEGPWHQVDRTWLIHADGTALTQVHHRTMLMEIEGHEFFGGDGKTVWYDLQTPRGEDFWLGGYEIASGVRTWYHLQRDEWSVHFNVSPDGKLFAGDGGGEGMVAHAKNGKWIYLFRPELIADRSTHTDPSQPPLIRPGVFHAERLVDMSRHDYSLEPNVTFTPDQKWIVFRSNMFGPTHVFAVSVEAEKQ
jgi:oligogalacturonide lyase